MSSTKLNPTRALTVFPSERNNIPYPNVLASGTCTGVGGSVLEDSAFDFITETGTNTVYAVNVGDVVYNTTTGNAITITEVVSKHVLNLNDTLMNNGDNYVIYQQGATTGIGNQGCILYLAGTPGSSYTLEFTTIAGDEINLVGVQLGIFPVQVKRVKSFNGDKVIALW